jgi:hypothetical protein
MTELYELYEHYFKIKDLQKNFTKNFTRQNRTLGREYPKSTPTLCYTPIKVTGIVRCNFTGHSRNHRTTNNNSAQLNPMLHAAQSHWHHSL